VDPLPLSLLNDFLYCPRRAALKAIEGHREENEHTIRGDIAHEHADLPGYEVANGVTLLRALPVWSERLGLSGKCDIVEVAQAYSPAGSSGIPPDASCGKMRPSLAGQRPALRSLRPVEYKKGRRRQFDNDDAQLCAQALCLEEMFGIVVDSGAVFHATSKRRRDVEFTAELRQLTENAIAELRVLLAQSEVSNLRFEIPKLPPAVFKPACEECSLFEICLPRVTSLPNTLARAARRLFEV
jgi:CRISPR-associated exonuclease Cas4